MAHVSIDATACKGCGLCVGACPKGILMLDEKHLNDNGYPPAARMDEAGCIGCAACAIMCPECAIVVER